MKINAEHTLETTPTDGVTFEKDFPAGVEKRTKITPRIVVIHYSVTKTLSQLVSAMRHQRFFAHFAIDGYSEPGKHGAKLITQMLPANVMGSHCGVSAYNGSAGCNAFSVGIEIANPGPLLVKKEEGSEKGHLETVWGLRWPSEDAVAHKPPKGYPSNWKAWAKYSEEEMQIVIDLCKALREKYPTIIDVVGHSTIAPGRKFDPGPAFDLARVKKAVFGEG